MCECFSICYSVYACAAHVKTARVRGGRGTAPVTLAPPRRTSGPPDSSLNPTVLRVPTSCNFLKRNPETPQVLAQPRGSTGTTHRHPNLSSLFRRGRKDESRKKGGRAEQLSLCPACSLLFFLLPFEVVRHSFKPHCTPTLNTRESVMNMYQHSIWQQ